MPAACVFDASAMLALIFRERGHAALEAIVARRRVHMSSVNVAETLHVAQRRGHRRSRDQLYDDLVALGIRIEPVGPEEALEIAYLLERAVALPPPARTLSLGDAACLALATRLGIPAVASDAAWEVLDERLEVLPFR